MADRIIYNLIFFNYYKYHCFHCLVHLNFEVGKILIQYFYFLRFLSYDAFFFLNYFLSLLSLGKSD